MSQYELKLIDRRPSARDRKIFQRKILSEGYCIWRKARNLRLRIYGPPLSSKRKNGSNWLTAFYPGNPLPPLLFPQEYALVD